MQLPAISEILDLGRTRTVLYQSGQLVHGPYGSGLVSYLPQTLTTDQQEQARENIGAVGSGTSSPFNMTEFGRALASLVGAANGKFPVATDSDAAAMRDLVGTVSQSSGVPTGSLTEIGSNSNGLFFRIVGGLQVCLHAINEDAEAWSTATGSVFTRATNLAWTFPASFATTSGLMVGGIVQRNQGIASGLHLLSYNTTLANVRPWSSISQASATVKTVLLAAAGRWHT